MRTLQLPAQHPADSRLRSLSLLPTRGQDELLIKEELRRGWVLTPELS